MSQDNTSDNNDRTDDGISRPQVLHINVGGRRTAVYYNESQRRLGVHSQETPPPQPQRERVAVGEFDPEAEKIESLQHIRSLAGDIPQGKLQEMLLYYNGSVEGEQMCRRNDSLHFLNTLVQNGKLSATKLIYLQVLLWRTDQKSLFNQLTEMGRLFENRGLPMEYFSRPTLEPVNAFRYVHLHLTSAFDDEAVLRQRQLLSRYLKVPLEYIVLAGVTPSNSFWLTLLIPENSFSAFLEATLKKDATPWLRESQVNKISFLQDTLPTDMEAMIEAKGPSQNKDLQGSDNSRLDADVVFGKKAGYWLTLQMPGDVHSRLLDTALSGEAVAIMASDVDKISFLSSPPQSLHETADQNETEDIETEMPSQWEIGAIREDDADRTEGVQVSSNVHSSPVFVDQESREGGSYDNETLSSDIGFRSIESILKTREETEVRDPRAVLQALHFRAT